MGLFKSQEERRIERDMQIRKTQAMFKKRIKELSKAELDFIENAKDSKKIGSKKHYELARKAYKESNYKRKRVEQQILTLSILTQMKNQVEADAEFAKSFRGVSKTISELFKVADLATTQKDFEMAMQKAKSMEERMDVFLESSNDMMLADDDVTGDTISDDEFDKLVEDEAVHDESDIDDEIESGLKQIEKEISKDKK